MGRDKMLSFNLIMQSCGSVLGNNSLEYLSKIIGLSKILFRKQSKDILKVRIEPYYWGQKMKIA